ncbi:MAG TPA: iron-sulfur cluster assembly scaffold protein [Anaerolineae bacterium]
MNRQEQIEFILDHFENPRRKGALPDADASVEGGNPGCGDIITMYLKVDPQTGKAQVTFEGTGCTISQASASYLSELTTGKTVEEILAIDYQDLMEALGHDIVQQRTRCATLSLDTLRAAIRKLERERTFASLGQQ